jgi:hypothetical protein
VHIECPIFVVLSFPSLPFLLFFLLFCHSYSSFWNFMLFPVNVKKISLTCTASAWRGWSLLKCWSFFLIYSYFFPFFSFFQHCLLTAAPCCVTVFPASTFYYCSFLLLSFSFIFGLSHSLSVVLSACALPLSLALP